MSGKAEPQGALAGEGRVRATDTIPFTHTQISSSLWSCRYGAVTPQFPLKQQTWALPSEVFLVSGRPGFFYIRLWEKCRNLLCGHATLLSASGQNREIAGGEFRPSRPVLSSQFEMAIVAGAR